MMRTKIPTMTSSSSNIIYLMRLRITTLNKQRMRNSRTITTMVTSTDSLTLTTANIITTTDIVIQMPRVTVVAITLIMSMSK